MTQQERTNGIQSHLSHFQDDTCPPTDISKSSVIMYSEFTNGGDDPNWRRKVSQGSDATNPLFKYSQSYETGSFSNSGVVKQEIPCRNGKSFSFSYSDTMWYGSPSLPAFPGDLGSAYGAMLSAYRQRRTQFETGTFLGELGETLRMIRNPLRTLRSSVGHYLDTADRIRSGYRNATRSKRRAMNQGIQNLYLEYKFGWLPLISDIKDGLAAYKRVSESKPRNYVLRTHSDVRGPVTSSTAMSVYPINGPMVSVLTQGTNVKVKMTMGITESASKLKAVKDSFGLDPFDNFLPTVWNLIPYSFVIDYFSNIGDVISQSCTTVQDCAYLVETVVREGTYIWSLSPNYGALPETITSAILAGGTSRGRTWSISRRRMSPADLNAEKIHFKMPSSDSSSWLNLASLLASRIKST